MKKSRFTETQIVSILKEGDEVCAAGSCVIPTCTSSPG